MAKKTEIKPIYLIGAALLVGYVIYSQNKTAAPDSSGNTSGNTNTGNNSDNSDNSDDSNTY